MELGEQFAVMVLTSEMLKLPAASLGLGWLLFCHFAELARSSHSHAWDSPQRVVKRMGNREGLTPSPADWGSDRASWALLRNTVTYILTQYYLPPDTSECAPTLTPGSKMVLCSIYLPQRDGRLTVMHHWPSSNRHNINNIRLYTHL